MLREGITNFISFCAIYLTKLKATLKGTVGNIHTSDNTGILVFWKQGMGKYDISCQS